MRRHWQYLKYVLRHKWFVFIAGLRITPPHFWQWPMWIFILIFHDWDKFLPDEWFPYARFFHKPDGTLNQRRDETGYYKPDDTGDPAFDFAWLLHQKRNRHHWQWWTVPRDDGTVKVFRMSELYIREMIADWRGAGRAQGTPNTYIWYEKNKEKLQLHPDTRLWIESYFKKMAEFERIERMLGI